MNQESSDYQSFFQTGISSSEHAPHPWQAELAAGEQPRNRLIRIPTGMGKTLGVLSTWLWHRAHNENAAWPRRLVWCLPMRTLVEQTVREAGQLLKALNLQHKLTVRTLMGGSDEQRWYDNPACLHILVGTQDMLLSRALNRGYAMGRAAWPRAYGLLNTDSLWVMDEVQLMDVGLVTSGQLQAFANSWMEGGQSLKRYTWWMSATLQPAWLKTPETSPWLTSLQDSQLTVDHDHRAGPQWDATKPVVREAMPSVEWANLILQRHAEHEPDPRTGRQTLVVVNTVKQACDLYLQVQKQAEPDVLSEIDLRLVHSRFRPAERATWADEFLSKESLSPDTNRLLIATQVVEAGVDISASCLITELAPWPGLVQRFGRAARYGGHADVIVLDQELTDEKKVLPYTLDELDAARQAIHQLQDVSIGSLEDFEAQQPDETIAKLFPYSPLHILLQQECEELFDTSPDLSGNDVDVSRFIRSGEDRSVQLFWRDWSEDSADQQPLPQRPELCAVPLTDVRTWLRKKHISATDVYTWDYVDGLWQRVDAGRLCPGQLLMVSTGAGGYSTVQGFTAAKADKKAPVLSVWQAPSSGQRSDADFTDSSDAACRVDVWKTIATHGHEAAQLAVQCARDCDLDAEFEPLLDLVMRLHDWGKGHPAFANGTYRVTPLQADLAKAPASAWRAPNQLYDTPETGHRRGFRHELVSCLALLELLRGADPRHPAVLGRYATLLEATGVTIDETPADWQAHPLAEEAVGLSEPEANLALYLIASHHGKVRLSLQSSPVDQEFPSDNPELMGRGQPVRGVRQDDVVPPISLFCDGETFDSPEIELDLSPASMGLSERYGVSWTERVQSLMAHYGPFRLAQLEAIVRSADGRASDDSQSPCVDADELLDGEALSVPSASKYPSLSE